MRLLLASIALAVAGLVGCAVPGVPAPMAPKAPVFQINTPIDFSGFHFVVQRAAVVTKFRNWVGQETHAGDKFLIVSMTVENKTGTPQPFHFQPGYLLADYRAATYEPHLLHTAMINLNQPGALSGGQVMNPNVRYRLDLVFEVPDQPYFMRVLVPDRVRSSMGGLVSSGPYFLVDLAPSGSASKPAAAL